VDALREHPSRFAEAGFSVVSSILDSQALDELCSLLDTNHPGQRNLLDVPAVNRLARSEPIRKLAASVLGHNCFAEILFNKTVWRTGK
jgi:hypothetical protein